MVGFGGNGGHGGGRDKNVGFKVLGGDGGTGGKGGNGGNGGKERAIS